MPPVVRHASPRDGLTSSSPRRGRKHFAGRTPHYVTQHPATAPVDSTGVVDIPQLRLNVLSHAVREEHYAWACPVLHMLHSMMRVNALLLMSTSCAGTSVSRVKLTDAGPEVAILSAVTLAAAVWLPCLMRVHLLHRPQGLQHQPYP